MADARAEPAREAIEARHARQLDRDLEAILRAAAGALIDQFHAVGIGDPADIARRLNRRGFPCFGRPRWTAAAVKTVLRRKARDMDGGATVGPQESACAVRCHGLGSRSAST